MSDDGLAEAADRIMRAALAAADPAAAVRRGLALAGVPASARVRLCAVGKAAAAMAAAALGELGERVREAVVVVPHGYTAEIGRPGHSREAPEARGPRSARRLAVFHAGHPVPDARGLEAACAVLALIDGMGGEELCILLLSGGGSSLLPMPRPPLTLADKQETTSLLLRSGADIHEINAVRKHLSAIKGGQLAERCRGTIVTLAMSDVVGDLLASVASGPTVPDPSTFAEARDALSRHALLDRAPQSVRRLIESGCAGIIRETPKQLPERHRALLVASNGTALDAASAEAARLGFNVRVLTRALQGEARDAGGALAAAALAALAARTVGKAPICLLMGGETTVTVRGSGTGGRNQELALAAAVALEGASGIRVQAFATDGKEGSTDAAGAFADGASLRAGKRAGLDPDDCLERNDTHAFHAAAGSLIVTGPTSTNVNDIAFALVR